MIFFTALFLLVYGLFHVGIGHYTIAYFPEEKFSGFLGVAIGGFMIFLAYTLTFLYNSPCCK